jgi:hypothetical protein
LEDFTKSENSVKWLTLGINKVIFNESTVGYKYQNERLDVQATQKYHLFSWKRPERSLGTP